jgi:hypothetical protein
MLIRFTRVSVSLGLKFHGWFHYGAQSARMLLTSHRLAQAAPELHGPPVWPALSKGDLDSLTQAVDLLGSDGNNVKWLPAYGSALLFLKTAEDHIQPAADDVALVLVGLDDWDFRVHR